MMRSETLAETMLLTRGPRRGRVRLRFVALVMAVAVVAGLLDMALPSQTGSAGAAGIGLQVAGERIGGFGH